MWRSMVSRGVGLRYFVPYKVTQSSTEPAESFPLVFLPLPPGPWRLWTVPIPISGAGEGLAAVIGVNDNPTFADWVYLVVEHPPKPTTFKAVIGWERRRSSDRSNFEGVDVRR